MGKKSSSDSESEGSVGSPREPPELVDPITLTIMEEAVMVSCGHSFSKSSITQWLHQQGVTKTCPVCKTPITEQSVTPNWALRNAVDRYNQKHHHGEEPADSAGTGTYTYTPPPQADDDDHPLKPSAPPAVKLDLASSRSDSASSASEEDDMPARPNPIIATTPATTTTTTSTPVYSPPAGVYGGQDEEEGGCCDCDCSCCSFDKPSGDHGCCLWECDGCGVCKMADDCNSSWLMLFPTSTVTCKASFGDWSNWYSRSACGSIYPLWVVVVLFLMCLDICLFTAFWTLWSFWILFGMTFFLLTHYFCPCVNECVKDTCGDTGSFILGNTC